MSLSREDVERIAHLARLELTADEVAQYKQQLSAVLDYAARLNALDLTDIAPSAHAVDRQNVMRADVIEPSLPLDEVLFNAARTEQDQFLIQAVLDES